MSIKEKLQDIGFEILFRLIKLMIYLFAKLNISKTT